MDRNIWSYRIRQSRHWIFIKYLRHLAFIDSSPAVEAR